MHVQINTLGFVASCNYCSSYKNAKNHDCNFTDINLLIPPNYTKRHTLSTGAVLWRRLKVLGSILTQAFSRSVGRSVGREEGTGAHHITGAQRKYHGGKLSPSTVP